MNLDFDLKKNKDIKIKKPDSVFSSWIIFVIDSDGFF